MAIICILIINSQLIRSRYIYGMTDTEKATKQSRSQAELGALEEPGVSASRADLDVSHASAELVSLVLSFLHDLGTGEIDALLKHFSPQNFALIDVVFDDVHDNIEELREAFVEIEGAVKPGAQFYPTKVLGDTTSGVVFFTGEPGAEGHELNAVAPINLVDDLIGRFVVYSDGRHFTRAGIEQKAPDRKPIKNFEQSIAGVGAAPEIKRVAEKLGRALANQDSVTAASLFASDGTFEDLTLHASIFGTFSIQGFFERALHALPYGQKSSVLHVVGSAQGGGYEWTSPQKVGHGIIALELDAQGLITQASAMWDGSLVSATFLESLLGFTIEDEE